MVQFVNVKEYNPDWKKLFEEEAELIRSILGDNCKAVHHIGSTAVEGLAAKPIIDIMPVVADLAAVDEAAELFKNAGYEYMGEFGMPGRRYLRKGGVERTHQVHIFSEENEGVCHDIERHLAVRDYLRANPEVAEEYGALKSRLARKYPYDIEAYCDGKDAFVQSLEMAALKWSRDRREWAMLYKATAEVHGKKRLSPFMDAGKVSAALLSAEGNVYVGVSIEDLKGLGMCAERNAAANMITNGEQQIKKMIIIAEDGKCTLPCGECKDFLLQMDRFNEKAEVLLSLQENKADFLKNL